MAEQEYRTEHDSLGEVLVPADRYWGAQTERSRNNFPIGRGKEPMPEEIIHAFAMLKAAAARANRQLRPDRMTEEKCAAICAAAEGVRSGALKEHFPLVVSQTGSGTQSNMNVNEVLANRGNEIAGKKLLHPNDDVNMSQSSNDTFPTALHIAAAVSIEERVLPALEELTETLRRLETENADVLKCGRTHLQDATPIRFSQEISGWRASLERDAELLRTAGEPLHELALGGTAVGTGLNAPERFDRLSAGILAEASGIPFRTAENKFHALAFKDELVAASKGKDKLVGSPNEWSLLRVRDFIVYNSGIMTPPIIKKELSRDFFTSDHPSTLYFYIDDIKTIHINSSHVPIIQSTFKALLDKAQEKHLTLILLVPTDKYDLYQQYIVDNPYPPKQVNETIKSILNNDPHVVLAKDYLQPLVDSGEKDVYLYNDTHWSYKAASVVADEVYDRIQSLKE